MATGTDPAPEWAADAAQRLGRAVGLLTADGQQRAAALCLARLALLHVHSGGHEEAVHVTKQAVDAGAEVRSVRLASAFTTLRAAAAERPEEPELAEVVALLDPETLADE